jgi:hypothetical protein
MLDKYVKILAAIALTVIVGNGAYAFYRSARCGKDEANTNKFICKMADRLNSLGRSRAEMENKEFTPQITDGDRLACWCAGIELFY